MKERNHTDNKISLNSIKENTLDILYGKNTTYKIIEQNDFCNVYRIISKNKHNDRVLIVVNSKVPIEYTVIAEQFGNVDIAVPKSQCNEDYLSAILLAYISKYLSGGQLLNLSKYGHYFQDSDLSHLPFLEENYFSYYQYCKSLSSGRLIDLSLPPNKPILHFTDYKTPIIETNEINVSRAGCLGSAIYCTATVGENVDALSGFGWGLYNRKVDPGKADYTPKANKFLGISLNHFGNDNTNWLNRFGYGKLYLKASQHYYEQLNLDDRKKFDAIKAKCKLAYVDLIPFFNFVAELITQKNRIDSDVFLEVFNELFLSLQKNSASVFLNNLFFDLIKDYFLIHNDGNKPSNYQNHADSFDMHKFYEIVFSLVPDMKISWNTAKFSPSIQELFSTLDEHGFALNEQQNFENFVEFLKQGLLFYIAKLVFCGDMQLPLTDEIDRFEQVIDKMAGLAGLIWHFYSANETRNTTFFDKYLGVLRGCEETFLNDNNINFAVKSGFFRTEEIGVYQHADVEFFEIEFAQNASGQYHVVRKRDIPLKLSKCPSVTNGMTPRVNTNPAINQYAMFSAFSNKLLQSQNTSIDESDTEEQNTNTVSSRIVFSS